MSNGKMSSWEEWNGLTEEQRQYSLYKTLQSLDNRLSSVENRKVVDKVCAVAGGIGGGFLAVIGKWAIWK